MRPIVDGIDSPFHELARYLAKLIKPTTGKTESHVKNSYDFVDKIRAIQVSADEILVSFDVTSLFTNVPKEKATELTRASLQEDNTLKDRTTLSADDIVKGVTVCLNSAYFVYNNRLFNQMEGLAMGSPLSPVLANIYMEDFETKVMMHPEIAPRMWIRYVDDTFVIIKRERLDRFNNFINSIDPNIKFTMEVESETGQLSFLDCMVHRMSNGKLKTTVHKKPTDTGSFLSYTSAHPKQVFASIAKSALKRAQRLCTEEEDRRSTEVEISNRLAKYGYPKN
ncbi:MAG: reverse transcriptase domain-containing protein [Tannerellaceae bacterium]